MSDLKCLPILSSSSSLRKNHHRQVKSNDLFRTFEKFKQSYNKLTENDSICVSSLYCNKYETIDTFDQQAFRETSLKYNIGKELEKEEKNEITQYLSSKKDPQITFHIPNELRFSNPFKSKKVLKLNSEIYSTVMSIRTANLCDTYANEIIKTNDQLDTISKMPKIRISKITKKFNPLNTFANDFARFNNLGNDKNTNNNKASTDMKTINTHTHTNSHTHTITHTNTNNNTINADNTSSNNNKAFFPKIARQEFLTSLLIQETLLPILYHPSTRSQFALCLTDEDVCFIYGGILGERLGDLWYCDMKQSKLTWNKIVNIRDDDIPIPRYGHTMTFWQDYLYIYGGNLGKEYYKPREDIAIYDINKKQYLYPSIANKITVPFRRSHIAISIGQSMLIHGGIDETDMMLNDIWIYDYNKNRFFNLQFQGINGMTPPYLAFHSAILISNSNRSHSQMFNIYKLPDNTFANKGRINRLKYEGVYIFGGLDSNKKCTQKLWIVKIGKKPVDILEPRTHGKPPLPRKLCIMTSLDEINLLVIHGGKNDQLHPEYLNDIVILDMETFHWIHPKQKSDEPTQLAEHCGFSYQNKVFILGGLNQNGYAKFDFLTLEIELENY